MQCRFIGEVAALSEDLQPGDMFFVPYYHRAYKHGYCPWDDCDDPRGHLMVVLPCGHIWDIDTRAKNCDRKDDRSHRCWVRHGEPPDITVDKAGGPTCRAGAGSIQCWCGSYHGHLTGGVLT